MQTARAAYEPAALGISEDGLIELWLGRATSGEDVFKSILFHPFCGVEVPYKSRAH